MLMKTLNLKLRSYLGYTMVICFLMLATEIVPAQTVTPAIMTQINGELQKRGLTENEVRIRLLQKGIDLENVPPAELPKYQERVTAVLDELQAEKKQANKTALPTTQPPANTSITIETGNAAATAEKPSETTALPATTKQEAEAEAAQRVVQEAAKKEGGSAIYGHSLFIDQSLKVFRTTDGAQAPETYVLGDGDEIRITIFGASQTDIQQKINADIFIKSHIMTKKQT
jgi:hypothetical protein